jgi:hypothetical protein
LIDRLEALERREIRKLMIFMPPGSAKSTYASVEFPPWYMGRRPKENVIAASHGEELAEDFGRKCRNIVADPRYALLWGHGLAEDQGAARRWANTEGGQYYAVGVGSSVTGRRGDLGLIDDPVKGQVAADSETEREKAWKWYQSDFLTRLKPGAAQIIIMTRWHEDDLAGRILKQQPGQWEVICLPMEAGDKDPLGRAKGERLWSDYFTDDMVQQAKLNPRTWGALYQQNPTPEEGTFFKREWFKFYKEAPKGVNKYLSSDFAVTEDGGDDTEIGIHGIAENRDLYLCLDGWGGQKSPDKWFDEYLTLVARHKTLCEFNEGGVIRRSIEAFLTNRRRERGVYGRCEWINPIGDKAARARSLQGMAAAGKVYLPDNEYGHRVLSDLLKFPASDKDHTVDMCGLMARALDEAHPGVVPAPVNTQKKDRWANDDDEETDTTNWKVA